MKHWFCEEMVTSEQFLVCAETWGQACDIAEEISEDFSCGCGCEPNVFVDPEPLTEDEAESTGLDEY